PRQLIYQRLDEVEQASVPELAKTLELSNSTVLRALRTLIDERRVESVGFARATRYRLRAPTA
ncbi:MAG TPA: helix-turn-helix domain-containing protein, partial [Kofleriaceae bacterium]